MFKIFRKRASDTPNAISEVTNESQLRLFTKQLLNTLNYQSIQESKIKGLAFTAEKDGILYAIQVEYQNSTLGIESVMNCATKVVLSGKHKGILVTNAIASRKVMAYAQLKKIAVWDENHLHKIQKNIETI